MNLIEKKEIEIFREIMSGIPADIPQNLDWLQMLEEMRKQAVVPLAYAWAKDRTDLPQDLKLVWKREMIRFSQRWYFMLEAQKNILSLLQKHGYKAAVLKGFANSVLFPNPELRFSNDIDILVCWEEYLDVYNLLLEQGYTLVEEMDEKKHHFEVTKNGVFFEIHKRPGGTSLGDERGGKRVLRYFQDAMNHLEEVEIYNYRFEMLGKEENGLMLLMHTAEHLHGGLGMRHILDWMVYAQEYLDNTYWNDVFQRIARMPGLEKLAMILTRTCQLYLGLEETNREWCKEIEDETCEELMEYLITQGNFGHKAGEADKEIKFQTDAQGNRGFFKTISASSLYSMPIAKEYRILRPIAWIYQVFRYIIKGLFRKNAWKRFRISKEEGKKRNVFFRKLNI